MDGKLVVAAVDGYAQDFRIFVIVVDVELYGFECNFVVDKDSKTSAFVCASILPDEGVAWSSWRLGIGRKLCFLYQGNMDVVAAEEMHELVDLVSDPVDVELKEFKDAGVRWGC